MTAAMLMEEAKPDQVHHQTHCPHPQDQFGVVDWFGLVEPLQALDSDGETERHKENGIDKSTKNLRPGPAECVFAPGLWRHSYRNESNY